MKRSVLLLILFTLTLPLSAHAGGPLGATGTAPRKYAATSFPLRYMLDQGTLGVFSNATAVSIATYAFQQWSSVPTATVSFTNAGFIARDVVSATDPLISGSTQWSDGINPVIFDANGTITDAKLGYGASRSVIGFAGSAYSGNTYVEGYAIINGAMSGTGTQNDIDTYRATMTHEIGHFLGLGHSQVAMHGDFCTMYPIVQKTSQRILQPDDSAAISLLYPATTFLTSRGSITGTVKSPTGANQSSVNVIAMEVSSGASYSTIVDYYSGGKQGFDLPPAATGTYTISGLRPGAYWVRVEPLQANFTGGSGVGSYNTPLNTSVAREWWNDGAESGDMLVDNTNDHTVVNVTAALTTTANFITNESNVVTTLVYHNGTPYYVWSLPQSGITRYATKFTAPYKGTLVGVQVRLAPQSVLPQTGTLTITVHQNTAGSLAGIPGAALGSITIPFKELAADSYNEIWLKGLGTSMNFDSLTNFHISLSTNGVGTPTLYTDNGSPTQNRTSYMGSDGVWHNFPDGGWAAGYNLIMSAVYAKAPAAAPAPVLVPNIALAPASLDFGQVRTRMTLDKSFRITNTGTGTLSVTGMSILGRDSSDYMIVSGGGSFTLTPNAFRDVVIRFQPCVAGGVEGPTKSAKVLIANNSPSAPTFLPLVGTAVEPAPLAVLAPITFKRARPGSIFTIDTALIYNAGLDTLHAESIAIVGPLGDTTIAIMGSTGSIAVAPDSVFKTQLRFAPVEIGNVDRTFRMLHDGFPAFTDIEITALGAAGQLTAPQSHTIYSVTSTTDNTLIVHNTGNDTLVLNDIRFASTKDNVPGNYFSTSLLLPVRIGPGDSLRLPITFTPIGEGVYAGSVTITSDSYPDTVATIPISVSSAPLAVKADAETARMLAPNPASAFVDVSTSTSESIEIFDALGRRHATPLLSANGAAQRYDVSDLPSGDYYLLIKSRSTSKWTKLVVKR